MMLIETKLSSTVVSTCTSTNATTSSEMFLCSPAVMTRGQCLDSSRDTPAMPRATVTVSSTRATTPVARVAYHSGLGPEVAAASRCAARTAGSGQPRGLARRGQHRSRPAGDDRLGLRRGRGRGRRARAGAMAAPAGAAGAARCLGRGRAA